MFCFASKTFRVPSCSLRPETTKSGIPFPSPNSGYGICKRTVIRTRIVCSNTRKRATCFCSQRRSGKRRVAENHGVFGTSMSVFRAAARTAASLNANGTSRSSCQVRLRSV